MKRRRKSMSDNGRFLVDAYGLGENVLPLVHSEEQIGNKLFFRRLSIKSGDEVISTPVISGNSFRGAWRDLAAVHLMQALSVKGVSKELFGVFFSGGMLTQETKVEFGNKLYRLFPTLRLFGFSMGSTMYASRIGVDFAVPLTAETVSYAKAAYPKLVCPDAQLEASDITGMTMLTRKDDEDKAILIDLEIEDVESEEAQAPGPTQMLFHVEYIVPNTTFVHGFRSMYPLTSLEFGALLKVLELSSDRSYGGMGSKGFGKMNWAYTIETFDKPGGVDAKPKTVRIGNQVTFDSTLEKYRKVYEEYVAGLAATLQADEDFANILQCE
jgi:hypothetical protein